MRNLQTGRRLLLLLTIVFIFVLAVSCTVSPEESSAPGTDDTAGQSLVADPVDSEATLSAVVDATIEARTSAVEGTAAAGLAIEATVGAAISETQQAMGGDPRPAPTTAAAAPPTAQPAATVMLVATSPPSGGARPAAPAQAAATAAPAVAGHGCGCATANSQTRGAGNCGFAAATATSVPPRSVGGPNGSIVRAFRTLESVYALAMLARIVDRQPTRLVVSKKLSSISRAGTR